jgi:hypothetical protein
MNQAHLTSFTRAELLLFEITLLGFSLFYSCTWRSVPTRCLQMDVWMNIDGITRMQLSGSNVGDAFQIRLGRRFLPSLTFLVVLYFSSIFRGNGLFPDTYLLLCCI